MNTCGHEAALLVGVEGRQQSYRQTDYLAHPGQGCCLEINLFPRGWSHLKTFAMSTASITVSKHLKLSDERSCNFRIAQVNVTPQLPRHFFSSALFQLRITGSICIISVMQVYLYSHKSIRNTFEGCPAGIFIVVWGGGVGCHCFSSWSCLPTWIH